VVVEERKSIWGEEDDPFADLDNDPKNKKVKKN
jgi:hypothetical protein